MPEQEIPEQQPVLDEMWAVFCGDINAANTAKLMNGLTTIGVKGTKRIHILFQSWGGFVGDGVFLYNAGQVASAAALAFLGATGRKTTTNAIFMIHKGANKPDAAGAGKLKAIAENLAMDDARIDEILRTHLRLPEELWTQFNYHDVFLSGADAVKYGMADEVAEFSPPVGIKVLNALG
jgi:ATP-dependent Clp protease protease subunit